MRKGVQQLAAIVGGTGLVLLTYALWRGTAAAWLGVIMVIAALAGLVAVHWPEHEDEGH